MVKGPERDFNSEFMSGRPNCVGYVLSVLGIINSDRFITPGRLVSYSDLFERVADIQSADGIAITTERECYLAHFALMEPGNPKFIIHRPGAGADIMREELSSVLKGYPSVFFQYHLLKLRAYSSAFLDFRKK